MHDMILDRYRLDRRLASGAATEVWLATDTTRGHQVVVKRLSPKLAKDPAAVERLRAEVATASRISHPSVVRVLDAGPSVAVLEHVPGETLAARLARGPMPSSDVTQVGSDIAGALAAVHAEGLLHRDVTPGNVLLDPGGRAHLADFGNALELGAPDPLVGSGWMVGTRPYVAPELLAGHAASPASDIWALGATLAEAVGGPDHRIAASGADAPPGSAPGGASSKGGPLATLVAQMLDPDPSARPSAQSVAAVLGLAAVHEPSPLAPTELLPVGPSSAEPAAVREPRRPDAPANAAAPWFSDLLASPASNAPRHEPRSARSAGATSRTVGASARATHPWSAITRRTAVAAAGVLVAAGVALAAATPAEPPAAGGGQPSGPLPLPSSSAPAPTTVPASGQGSLVVRPAHPSPGGRSHGRHGRGGG